MANKIELSEEEQKIIDELKASHKKLFETLETYKKQAVELLTEVVTLRELDRIMLMMKDVNRWDG